MSFGWKEEQYEFERRMAELMVESCRRAMPGCEVVQLTNQYTKPWDFVDRAITKEWKRGFNFLTYLCDFYEELGECLILDSDIIVQGDLRRLAELKADLVVPVRSFAVVADDGASMRVQMGVCYSNSQEVWKEIKRRVAAMEREVDRNWWGIQLVIWDMLQESAKGESKFNIKAVKHRDFNYTPKDDKDAPKDVWAIHYKGPQRKDWMLKRWGKQPQDEVGFQ